MRTVTALVLALGACEPDSGPNAYLEELPDLGVYLSTMFVEHDLATLNVSLYYDVPPFEDPREARYRCAWLGNLAATYNGWPLDVQSYGGPVEDDASCDMPWLRAFMPLPRDTAGELVISDDSRTIRATFAPGDIEVQYATLTTHPNWAFSSGDKVRFTWTHDDAPTDELVSEWVGGPVGMPDPAIYRVGDSDELQMTMPTVTSPMPAMIFEIRETTDRIGNAEGEALTCEGAAYCRWSRSHFHRLVSLTP